MRIVIDLQGAQSTGSRNRGIGRYTLWLTEALIRNRGDHEIVLALSEAFPDTIDELRAKFAPMLPRENVRSWACPLPVKYLESGTKWRRRTAELTREAFLASLAPDMVLVASLFEGLVDDAVTSIGTYDRALPTASILYDLIPLIHRKPYLDNPDVAAWYEGKLDHVRRADLLLAISDSSRDEGLRHLGFDEATCISISTATDPSFVPLAISSPTEKALRQRYGLTREIVMYTGGIDHRKNIEGLIRAYAKLPNPLRGGHQLAIVCSIQAPDRERLGRLAREAGLSEQEVIFTGFVSEEDLQALYNLCKLFVFPSWHEGFGLPALEAMCCGRAVIGSNTSSIPEVIGRDDALFDPRDEADIARQMKRVLTDDEFRAQLQRHSLEQSKKFSWDITARRAFRAMEDWHVRHAKDQRPAARTGPRPKLAFVSPLPPERSGISDYSAELLPELARHYDIEVVVDQETIADAWINANCTVRTVNWFKENGHRFQRVLYHFGNSHFHQHMFGLLERIPGVVVLHDFYLAHIASYMEATSGQRHWTNALYSSHGYAAIHDRFVELDPEAVTWKYPCSLPVIQAALGVIVHSKASQHLAEQWYGAAAGDDWHLIPLLRVPAPIVDREVARRRLALRADDFVVCAFGMLGPTKLSHRLLDAWLGSDMANDPRCILVFVGANDAGPYGTALLSRIDGDGHARVKITGWASQEMFRDYLGAADIAVQLRTLSRGETSAAVLDCMNYGLPTVVNAHGSMADLPDDAVRKITDEFEDEELRAAIESLWKRPGLRQAVGQAAQQIIRQVHSPRTCARQYWFAIEKSYSTVSPMNPTLVAALARAEPPQSDARPWADLARALACNFPRKPALRQLLVDISILVQVDAKTGIQRVVRSVLREWLLHPPAGFRVEPVYAMPAHGYRYAREFTGRFLECPPVGPDSDIEYGPDDLFVGLDLNHHICISHRQYYRNLRNHGVTVKFVVYDLLPTRMPDMFWDGAEALHNSWLGVIAENHGAVCISKAIADELHEWLSGHDRKRNHPFEITWAHLGADVESSMPTRGLPEDSAAVLRTLEMRPSFLMVGTIEPRKGYSQVLSAFERLWARGLNVNLVIVGKSGWGVDELAATLTKHAELDKRLIWLDGASDEYLKAIYSASDCLIAASEGEGFGLPLIEAAQHGLAIIARDIPVFKEVAREHAFFFEGARPESLSDAIEKWLDLYRRGKAPESTKMPRLTWQQSAQSLFEALIDRAPYCRHVAGDALHYRGSDRRLRTDVGERTEKGLQTTGRAGYLTYGPYASIDGGHYRVVLDGVVKGRAGNGSFVDVAIERGSRQLVKVPITLSDTADHLIDAEFVLDQACTDLEVRVWVKADMNLEIHRVQLCHATRPASTATAASPIEMADTA